MKDIRAQTSHLLRRAGFGATPAELDFYTELGFEGAVDRLVNYERVPDHQPDLSGLDLDFTKPEDARLAWLYRMAFGPRPLQEKMTLFWHGHFATSIRKVGNLAFMLRQIDLFRQNALGLWPDLLKKVTRDAAMMVWLDNRLNRKGAPNENYARELMELFALGIGNYTEQDVKEAARALTGWTITREGQFQVLPRQHDEGTKTILGQTGRWNGDDVVDIILRQPAAATFLTRKLFRFFVYDDPDDQTIERFANGFRRDYSVRNLVASLLLSDEFRSERAFHALIKSPVEFTIGALKQVGAQTLPRDLPAVLRRMGQDLYNPPTVEGWKGGATWVNTTTVLERYNFAARLALARGQRGEQWFDAMAWLGTLPDLSPEVAVDAMGAWLVDRDLADSQRRVLESYAAADDFGVDPRVTEAKVRGLMHLVMSQPSYMLS